MQNYIIVGKDKLDSILPDGFTIISFKNVPITTIKQDEYGYEQEFVWFASLQTAKNKLPTLLLMPKKDIAFSVNSPNKSSKPKLILPKTIRLVYEPDLEVLPMAIVLPDTVRDIFKCDECGSYSIYHKTDKPVYIKDCVNCHSNKLRHDTTKTDKIKLLNREL